MPILGAMLTGAFAPLELSWVALIVYTLLFKSINSVGIYRAVCRGYLFAVGLFLSGTHWVYISVHEFGGAHPFGSSLLTLFFALFWALFPAFIIFVIKKIRTFPQQLLNSFAVANVWTLVEYFRGALFLNGFPWLQAAYTQINAPLSGFVPLLGSYGCTFILIFCASLLAGINMSKMQSWIPFSCILAIYAGGEILRTVEWTDVAGKPIMVTLIQGNVSQDKKWLPTYRIKTLRSYQKMTQQHWDSDVIVWPETAIPAFKSQVEEFYLKPLEQQAIANHTDIIAGLPAKGKTLSENYNMAITLGKQRGEYNKNHLLPFGEYLPLQPLSGWVLDVLGVSLGNFVPGGDEQQMMVAGGYPFAMSICYEDAFAKVFLSYLPEAAYLVNITNDAWFGDSSEPYQHMQVARMRALESGRYLLRATNTGLTGIVDPKGKLIKQAPLFQKAALRGEIYPMTGMTPFAYIGDDIVILCLSIGLMFLLGLQYIKKGK